jgi:GntR family transcriptional regulator/MocR family aminotransferase
LELIRFAQENGSYILEDDYDSEFRYEGYPIHSLRELDKDRVIYVGTFSKTLFPSIRLGYLVLPEPLIAQCIEIKRLFDHHSNSLNQLAAMRFIDSGDLEKHIIRMNRVYKRRRNRMITKLKEKFNGEINIIGEASGLHFVAEFNNITFTPSLIRQIEQLGLSICTVEEHASIKGNHEQQVIIGFSHLTDEEMDQGIDNLYLAIKKAGCGVTQTLK